MLDKEEPNPIKDYLFDYVEKNETKFHKLLSENKIDEVIDDILENCYDTVVKIEPEKEVGLAKFATAILHYLLTIAMLSCQRKITHEDIEIDLVFPDLKTLLEDQKNSLVVCIPKTTDKEAISEQLAQLQKVQTVPENIWLVLSEPLDFRNKTFVIQKQNSTFSNIVYDIAQFVNVKGQNKFKILRV